MKEKKYYVNEDYPAETWEDLQGLTKECARRVLNDEEFAEWCKEHDERISKERNANKAWDESEERFEWLWNS